MSQADQENTSGGRNPLLWVALIVAGLIVFIFMSSDRGGSSKTIALDAPGQIASEKAREQSDAEADNLVNRDVVVPPGMRAREYIQQLRTHGQPYQFDAIMGKASRFATEGSLADAHLVFFFAAREGHIEAMMMLAEMSDPTLFRSENNLLDHADANQAYKWYRTALDKGFEPAKERLDNLQQWAKAEAEFGNSDAQQLLLNFN